jgi:hypothetical protein
MVEAEAGMPERRLLAGPPGSDWTSGVTEEVSKTFNNFINGILGGH